MDGGEKLETETQVEADKEREVEIESERDKDLSNLMASASIASRLALCVVVVEEVAVFCCDSCSSPSWATFVEGPRATRGTAARSADKPAWRW